MARSSRVATTAAVIADEAAAVATTDIARAATAAAIAAVAVITVAAVAVPVATVIAVHRVEHRSGGGDGTSHRVSVLGLCTSLASWSTAASRYLMWAPAVFS